MSDVTNMSTAEMTRFVISAERAAAMGILTSKHIEMFWAIVDESTKRGCPVNVSERMAVTKTPTAHFFNGIVYYDHKGDKFPHAIDTDNDSPKAVAKTILKRITDPVARRGAWESKSFTGRKFVPDSMPAERFAAITAELKRLSK
jgi:hypothetical protein